MAIADRFEGGGGSFYGGGQAIDRSRNRRIDRWGRVIERKGEDSLIGRFGKFRQGRLRGETPVRDKLRGKLEELKKEFGDIGGRVNDFFDPGSTLDRENDYRNKWLNQGIEGLDPSIQKYDFNAAEKWYRKYNENALNRAEGMAKADVWNEETQRWEGGYRSKVGRNVGEFFKDVTPLKTDLETDTEANLLAAQRGELSAPNTEFTQNVAQNLRNVKRTGDRDLAEQFGTQRGIGSGKFQEAFMRRGKEFDDTIAGVVSDLQKQQADAGIGYITSSNQLKNQRLEIASRLAQFTGTANLQANQQMFNRIGAVETRETQRANLDLQRQMAEFQQQTKQLDMYGNKIQDDRQYDIDFKNMTAGNLNDFFSNMITGLLGAGDLIQGANKPGGKIQEFISTLQGFT